MFDIAELREVTSYDELELDTLGDQKTALFLIMSDTDDSFNFLISMCYTQLFNLLCEKADDVYGGRLPVHVRCLIDEAANIGQIPRLEKLVATIRSREISACLVLQAQSQLKAIYKDNADTIIGNMDTSIFLGGKEPTTLKELAAVLGKETIDTYNTESRGRETSHSLNYQKLGKDLLCRYDCIIRDTYPDRTAFFPNQSGDYYSKSTLDKWFHEFWDQLPEAAVTKGNPPRVHDLRHSYCVYRLNQWVREHADLNALYPYLSEFMGHSNFADTDYYLTLAEPFYSEFESRMHSVNASILPEVPHED